MKIGFSLLSAVVLVAGSAAQGAEDSIGEPGRQQGSANPLKNVYFGEQHMHTRNSFDAFTVGVNQTWEEAYRYARGEEVTLSTSGAKIRKRTPYDFVAITDHAEYFGVLKEFGNPDSPLAQSDFARAIVAGQTNPAEGGEALAQLLASLFASVPMPEYSTPELRTSMWQTYVDTADEHYEPGEFTTLYAFEWTSIPDGSNMHRNVFFRDKAPKFAFSAFDSLQPEDLWTYLEIQRVQGINAFAIPHNSNVSNGWMFSDYEFRGGPMTKRYAKRQMENEPLFEMAQTKGQSETHPALSPNDEFADFELFDNLINLPIMADKGKGGFYRTGLATGLRLEQELGFNPYKMGVVAGGDIHSGYQANEEFNFNGSHGAGDDTAEKRLSPKPGLTGEITALISSAGTTAVWATENTREAIFDAMQAQETYGTSGTLIRLRFFGGWGYDDDLLEDKDFIQQAYDNGVPMGSDLPAMPKRAKRPTFAVWALKDPDSGNLDRIQIIKVWANPANGLPMEKVYDVTWSDTEARQLDDAGKVAPVGNTVNASTATYTNDIGAAQLGAVWSDPDFDPDHSAAYYVRVLEIPTPRWSTYDAVKLGREPMDAVPVTIQERAWSSPIWYTPTQ